MSPTYDQPLSLAFRSAVRSANQSPDPWPDIESSLLVYPSPSTPSKPLLTSLPAGIIFIVGVLIRLRTSAASCRTYQATVTKLVHISLQHLARHAIENPTEPWIGTVQLRDQVLQHEFSPDRRRKLWEGVQKIVEMNSNVRAGEREISGEVMRVWTWIGGRVSTSRLGDVGYVAKAGEEDSRWAEYPRVIV